MVYDSDVERDFAAELERNEAIKVYAKLPGWFKVPTPLGSYNPDWAVLVRTEDGSERLYFVVETKGTVIGDALRPIEDGKIKCGKAHFKALAVGERRRSTLSSGRWVGCWRDSSMAGTARALG